jgi:hypothetical protein
MSSDLIVEEIRRLRDEYAKQFNYDLKAMFEDLRQEQRTSGRTIVSLPAKRASSSRATIKQPVKKP